jgi:hypothetical protein
MLDTDIEGVCAADGGLMGEEKPLATVNVDPLYVLDPPLSVEDI